MSTNAYLKYFIIFAQVLKKKKKEVVVFTLYCIELHCIVIYSAELHCVVLRSDL